MACLMGGKPTMDLILRDSSNGDEDPDMDGWDRDGDGSAVYEELVFNTRVTQVKKTIGETVAEG